MGRGGFRAGGGARLHRRRPGTCRRGGRALRGPSRARYARCTPRPRVGWGAVRIIEQIGSYAGLAAIPGIAVLSALYFSQARDVRRLRDWAGRAPERAAEQAQGGRVTAQPQAQAQPARVPAAAGAAAQPATQGGNGSDAQKTGERTPAKPGALTPAAVAPAAAGTANPPARAPGAATGTVARPAAAAAAGARPAAATGGPPRRQIPRVPAAATAIRPASREPDPWYRRLADRLPAGRY